MLVFAIVLPIVNTQKSNEDLTKDKQVNATFDKHLFVWIFILCSYYCVIHARYIYVSVVKIDSIKEVVFGTLFFVTLIKAVQNVINFYAFTQYKRVKVDDTTFVVKTRNWASKNLKPISWKIMFNMFMNLCNLVFITVYVSCYIK